MDSATLQDVTVYIITWFAESFKFNTYSLSQVCREYDNRAARPGSEYHTSTCRWWCGGGFGHSL